MPASIRAIATHFPEAVLDNAQLAARFPDWTPEKIEQKTGIAFRRVAAEGETSSDLACQAAARLFASGICRPEEIGYLILVTQSPDHFMPTSACILQHRLGLPTSAGALDVNQGCSGWIYGLGLAKAIIESGQAARVLLLTAETFSKFMHPEDKGSLTIFGDGAAATLVEAAGDSPGNTVGQMVYGTDGSGADNLIIRNGAFRNRGLTGTAPGTDKFGNLCSADHFYMNGPEVFNFTLRTVPSAVNAVLAAHALELDQVDIVVFHQANKYMLDHLRQKLRIPSERFLLAMRDHGNITSSTIPNALLIAEQEGRIRRGARVLALGFGVGYSWGGTVLNWEAGLSLPKS